jgi:hypothetical protein
VYPTLNLVKVSIHSIDKRLRKNEREQTIACATKESNQLYDISRKNQQDFLNAS